MSNKRNIKISYLDEAGDKCSITQMMSREKIGSWVWYFLDNGGKVIGVEYADKKEVSDE
jgi:ribulose bisphosphate carboxylase small subunit